MVECMCTHVQVQGAGVVEGAAWVVLPVSVEVVSVVTGRGAWGRVAPWGGQACEVRTLGGTVVLEAGHLAPPVWVHLAIRLLARRACKVTTAR